MNLSAPKGTRDYLPDDMELMRRIFASWRSVFDRYGFREIDTPAFESYELFSTKGAIGDETVKDIYVFEDKSKRKLALRPEMTASVARVFASGQFQMPVRWYYIAKMWRYDEIKRGRSREFMQAGAEFVGPAGPAADAEIVKLAIDCIREIGIEKFKVRINSRIILNKFAEKLGIEDNGKVFRELDKLDKKGEAEVRKALNALMPEPKIDELFRMIRSPLVEQEIDGIMNSLGEEYAKYVVVDYSVARGLDYYTGFIFEIIAEGYESIGSLLGGGRYDELIQKYGGRKTPAVGFSIGVERILEILRKNTIPSREVVYIAPASDSLRQKAGEICNSLRNKGIACETDFMNRNLSNQLKYAGSFSKAVIVGENDIKNNEVTVRDMISGSERKVKLERLAEDL